MTQTIPSMTPFVELHRTIIKQNQAFAHDAAEAQRTAMEAATAGIETWGSIARQNVAFARTMSDITLDNLEATMPGEAGGVDEARTMVDDQLTLMEEVGEESFELTSEAVAEGQQAYGEFLETSLEAFDAGIDAYLVATEEVASTAEAAAESIEIED